MTTGAFFAARTVIDRLGEQARPGLPLDGVQVAYGWNGKLQTPCVYIGELSFPQVKGPTAGGADTLVREDGTTSLYLRVVQSLAELPEGQDADDGVRAADGRTEHILDAIGGYILGHPRLLGPGTDIFPAGGRRDYSISDFDVTAVTRFDLTYACFLGGA